MKSNRNYDQQTTPFIDSDSYLVDSDKEVLSSDANDNSLEDRNTPFLSIYELGENGETSNPEEDEKINFIAELYDEELNRELYELANEVSEIYETELASEFNSDSEVQQKNLQHQLVEEYTTFFSREIDKFFYALTESVESKDIDQMSNTEIDNWVDEFVLQYEASMESDFEEESPLEYGLFKKLKKRFKKAKNRFKGALKKVRNKVAKTVKKAVKVAKKVAGKVGKFFLRGVLRRLKKLIGRFFVKLLNSRLVRKHLPPRYRELLLLIRRMMNKRQRRRRREIGVHEIAEFEQYFDEYAFLQYELDVHISNLLSAETEAEADRVIESYDVEEDMRDEQILKELDIVRDKFIYEISRLPEGEDPSPHVENFVTAILQAMRVVLRPIVTAYGRTKTINKIIAPLLFKILKKFIRGKSKRPILKTISRILGDIGLKVLLKMEVSEEIQNETAAESIANIAEETMHGILQLPEYAFQDEAVIQSLTMEVFEHMASANLPPILPENEYLSNLDLREASVKGAWLVYRPERRRKRHCKKYSKIFRRKISPYMLKEIKTFGEITLDEFLNERLDVPVNEELEVNIHLYEAINEANLYQISETERNVPGLNIETEFGYQLLHPLTPINAGLLLGEPGLGRKVDNIFLASPRTTRPGQRFFYLEMGNIRPKVMMDSSGMNYLKRISELNQSFNFIQNRIKIHLYLSERKAQQIALKLRSGSSYGYALSFLLKIFDNSLKIALAPSMIHKRTKVVHPYITPGPNSGWEFIKIIPESIQELFKDQLTLWAAKSLSEFVKQNTQQFIVATEDDHDGVTVSITLDNPPGFMEIKEILSSNSMNIPQDFLEGNPENIQVKINPGFYYH